MKSSLFIFATMIISFCANAQWAEKFSGFQENIRGLQHIDIASADVVWGVAWDGKISPVEIQEYAKSIDGGNTWTTGKITAAKSSHNASAISAVSADSAWVTMFDTTNGEGAVFRTTNGGATWEQMADTKYAPPYGYPDIIHFWDAKNGIVIGDPNEGDEGYFSFEIYRTSDGGDNWARVPRQNIPVGGNLEMPMITQFSVAGDYMWFPTTKGRIFRSSDRGEHWQAFETPMFQKGIFMSLAFKDSLNGLAIARESSFLNSADKGIYKTTDGGRTWTQVATGTAGGVGMKNGIAFIPNTANAYVITGSEMPPYGSAYTTDGGATWNNLDSIKHYKVYFYDFNTGYSGSFSGVS